MHPNLPRYPFRTFMLHAKSWKRARELTDVNPRPDEKDVLIHIGDDRSPTAMVARVSHMVSASGAAGKARDFQAKRFHLAMAFIAQHMGTLQKEFIMIQDGSRADTPTDVLAAVHEAFLGDPPPSLSAVEVSKVVARAKAIEREGIFDAP